MRHNRREQAGEVAALPDALVVGAALAFVSRTAGRDVVADRWPGSERGLQFLFRVVAGTG